MIVQKYNRHQRSSEVVELPVVVEVMKMSPGQDIVAFPALPLTPELGREKGEFLYLSRGWEVVAGYPVDKLLSAVGKLDLLQQHWGMRACWSAQGAKSCSRLEVGPGLDRSPPCEGHP
jgi:hypothetical protein